jgi:hypothetical protein
VRPFCLGDNGACPCPAFDPSLDTVSRYVTKTGDAMSMQHAWMATAIAFVLGCLVVILITTLPPVPPP